MAEPDPDEPWLDDPLPVWLAETEWAEPGSSAATPAAAITLPAASAVVTPRSLAVPLVLATTALMTLSLFMPQMITGAPAATLSETYEPALREQTAC